MRLSALFLATLLPVALSAQEAELPNLDPAAIQAPGALARLVAGHALYRAAVADKDALAMLAAAHLAAGVTLVETARTPDPGSAEAAETPPGLPPDAAAMAEAARRMTDPEETLALLLAETGAGARYLAPAALRSTVASLEAGGAQDWRLPLDGGVLAEVGVIGAGAGVLRITLRDAAGNVICAPQTQMDVATCAFVPRESGYFVLRVENPAEAAVTYLLVTS